MPSQDARSTVAVYDETASHADIFDGRLCTIIGRVPTHRTLWDSDLVKLHEGATAIILPEP